MTGIIKQERFTQMAIFDQPLAGRRDALLADGRGEVLAYRIGAQQVEFLHNLSPLFLPLVNASRLHPRKRPMMRGQQPFRPFVFQNVRQVHEHAQQESVRINPELPLASIDLFSSVEAAVSASERHVRHYDTTNPGF